MRLLERQSGGPTARPASTVWSGTDTARLLAAFRDVPGPAPALAAMVFALMDWYGIAAEVRVATPGGPATLRVPAGWPELPFGDLVRSATLTASGTAEPGATIVVGVAGGVHGDPVPGCELALLVGPDGTDPLGYCRFDGSASDAESVAALLRHLDRFAAQALRRADAAVRELDPLTGPERRLLLETWNSPVGVRYPATTLHQMFAERAAATPSATALVDGDRRVTYAELEATANRAAVALRPFLGGPGEPVAVHAPRSAEMFACVMGVLKAGAAVTYLEPDFPPARLEEMLRIAAPRAVVRHHGLPRLVTDAPDLVLEEVLEQVLDGDAAGGPEEIAGPHTAAQILFTSGSTGAPKGVVRTHLVPTSRIFLEQSMYHLGAADRHLLKSAVSFREFVWPLATGGTAVIVPPGRDRDDEFLVGLIERERISVVSFVPSMLQILAANPRFGRCGSLRHTFVGGEKLSPALEERLRLVSPGVHNTYTTAEAEYVLHRGGPPTQASGSNVGRPLDMRVYLCDRHGRLVPPGAVGEIHTGGPGLASGYLNRPELTAGRFVPNHVDDTVPTLYRTGDLARFCPDGTVEFVGRADSQVKVRGLRVEPTEVEMALRRQPGVRDAVVTAVPDPAQGSLLVGYLASSAELTVEGVRDTLGRHLPAHMVPSYLVLLDALPMLASGKVDRAALRVLPRTRPELQSPFAAPVSTWERRIARVWSQVLGVPDVGLDDDFFALGGDSLRLMLLRSALESESGQDVSLALLLDCPTIRQCARAFEEAPA